MCAAVQNQYSDNSLWVNDKGPILGTSSNFKLYYNSSNAKFQIDDPSGNVMLSVTDSGTTGTVTLTGPIVGTATQSVFNTVATTVNAFGAATTVNMGAGAASTATLSFTTKINLNSGAIDSNQSTLALWATPTSITAGAAATTLNMGATTGTTTIKNNLVAGAVASGGEASVKVFNNHASGSGATLYLIPTSTTSDNAQFYRHAGANGALHFLNTGTGNYTWEPNAATALTLSSGGTLTMTGALIGTATQSCFNTTTTTLNLGGAATTLNMGAGAATTIALNSTAITSNQTTVALLNATPTTINFAGAATTLNMGAGAAATATLSFTTKINANTGAMDSNQSTVALWATPTTVTWGAAATSATLGATTGTATIRNATINLNGSTIDSSAATLGLYATPTTVTEFAAGTTINIGATTGTTTIKNNVNVGTPVSGGEAYMRIYNNHASGSDATLYLIPTSNTGQNSQWYRHAGANGNLTWLNTGTGSFIFQPNSATALTLASGGTLTMTGALVGTASQDCFNTVSTTGNLYGACTALTVGATTGTATIRNATVAISGATALTVTPPASFSDHVKLTALGKHIFLKEGSNAAMGVATLVAGTVTVSTTAIATGDRVILIPQTAGGVQGELSLGTLTNGTSFVINSSNVADTSTVLWIIVTPA